MNRHTKLYQQKILNQNLSIPLNESTVKSYFEDKNKVFVKLKKNKPHFSESNLVNRARTGGIIALCRLRKMKRGTAVGGAAVLVMKLYQ